MNIITDPSATVKILIKNHCFLFRYGINRLHKKVMETLRFHDFFAVHDRVW